MKRKQADGSSNPSNPTSSKEPVSPFTAQASTDSHDQVPESSPLPLISMKQRDFSPRLTRVIPLSSTSTAQAATHVIVHDESELPAEEMRPLYAKYNTLCIFACAVLAAEHANLKFKFGFYFPRSSYNNTGLTPSSIAYYEGAG